MDRNKIITTQIIEDVVNKSSSDRIMIHDIIDAMESIGFGLVMMIFSFGIVIPTPPPFPSIISLPLVIFSLQMAMGYSAPKLPKKLSNLSVKRSVLIMIVQKSSFLIRKVERFLKPRFMFLSQSYGERLVGVFLLIFSSFILIPMPLSNYIPGIGILITSFGMLSKDGLFIIIGIAVGIIGIIVSVLALFIGMEFFHYIKDFFTNIF